MNIKTFLLCCFFATTTIINPSAPLKKVVLTPQEQQRQRINGEIVIADTKKWIQFYSDMLDDLLAQAGTSRETLKKIEELEKKIKALKDRNKISPIEEAISGIKEQLDSAAVGVYAAAIDPEDRQNIYRKINRVIKDIENDDIIQSKLDSIRRFERDIAERITQKVESVQKLGLKALELTTNEQSAIDQVDMQLLPMQTQLISLKMQPEVAKQLPSLEQQLIKLKNEANSQLLLLPSDSRDNIRRYKYAIKRYNLILDYLRSPKKAAQATADELLLIE